MWAVAATCGLPLPNQWLSWRVAPGLAPIRPTPLGKAGQRATTSSASAGDDVLQPPASCARRAAAGEQPASADAAREVASWRTQRSSPRCARCATLPPGPAPVARGSCRNSREAQARPHARMVAAVGHRVVQALSSYVVVVQACGRAPGNVVALGRAAATQCRPLARLQASAPLLGFLGGPRCLLLQQQCDPRPSGTGRARAGSPLPRIHHRLLPPSPPSSPPSAP